jgi:type IV secretory pathway TrbD component
MQLEDGFEVPIHRSLTQPIMVAGLPRNLGLLLWTTTAAFALGLHQVWVLPVSLVLHAVFGAAAKRDPYFFALSARADDSNREVTHVFAERVSRADLPPSRLPPLVPVGGARCRLAKGRRAAKDRLVPGSRPGELVGLGAHLSVARLNNALKRLGSGWALFVEAQRFSANRYPTSHWRQPAAWIVDLERRKAFEAAGSHFESSYYLTFVWQMPATGQKRAQALFFDDPEAREPNQENHRDVAHFQKTVSELVDIMTGVFADVAELDDGETLSYLHSTISTHRHPIAVPETPMYIDALLPDMAFTPGDIPMLGDAFVPTCSIVGFPATSFPGLLDELNHLQVEYRWVTRFIAMDKDEAKVELEKFRKRWWQKRKGNQRSPTPRPAPQMPTPRRPPELSGPIRSARPVSTSPIAPAAPASSRQSTTPPTPKGPRRTQARQ